MAAISMSALRQISFKLAVRLWHTVTVASPKFFIIIKEAIGLPTMLERPSTTQCLPEVGML